MLIELDWDLLQNVIIKFEKQFEKMIKIIYLNNLSY